MLSWSSLNLVLDQNQGKDLKLTVAILEKIFLS